MLSDGQSKALDVGNGVSAFKSPTTPADGTGEKVSTSLSDDSTTGAKVLPTKSKPNEF